MGARHSLDQSSLGLVGAGSRIRFMPSQLEALKWLAVAAMLIEHTFEYLELPGAAAARVVGRLALPLFVLAFAYGLAQSGSVLQGAYRAAFRLLPFAVLAQFGAELVRGDGTLNVLFQFLAVAAWVAAMDSSPSERLLVRAIALFVAYLSEFTLPGFGVALGAVMYARRPHVGWATLGLSCMALIAFADGTPVAFLALPLLYFASGIQFSLPRIRNAFAVVYVAQFPIFLALRGLM